MEVTTEQDLIEMIRQMNIAQESLEQHHKDLMGLVEAWTNKIGPADGSLYSSGQSDAFRKCRNDLASLINPKD